MGEEKENTIWKCVCLVGEEEEGSEKEKKSAVNTGRPPS